jgi:putative flippase GtrA
LPPRAAELLRYGLVGGLNTAVSYAVYLVLLAAGVPYAAAAVAAFAAGAATGYLLNRSWTFRVRGSTGARVRYVAVQGAALGATNGLLWLLVDRAAVPAEPAYALAIAPVTVAGYAVNRAWTFRASSQHTHSSPAGTA